MIKRLIEFARKPSVRQRVAFIEDYDIYVARYLVQGADVWLNTPRRPFEASGTSGMKAAMNGVLNVSILDGWWDEGYAEERGWKIGSGEEYPDSEYQDSIDSQALFNVLENDVIPCFYERKNGDVPDKWLQMMKASIKMAMTLFSARSMVKKYNDQFYQPAIEQHQLLQDNHAEIARRWVSQHKRLNSLWKDIHVARPVSLNEGPFHVGETFQITTEVRLGELLPDEVEVELYHGNLKSMDTIAESHVEKMSVIEDLGNGNFRYGCNMECRTTGRFGLTVRVTPRGDNWIRFTPGLITWA